MSPSSLRIHCWNSQLAELGPHGLQFLSQRTLFLTFSLTPRSSQCRRKAFRLMSWSWAALCFIFPNPTTTKSSATTSMPSNPSMSSCILRWNTSGAEQIPNGICFQQYWPNGVWKVDRNNDGSSSRMCQNPLLTFTPWHHGVVLWYLQWLWVGSAL